MSNSQPPSPDMGWDPRGMRGPHPGVGISNLHIYHFFRVYSYPGLAFWSFNTTSTGSPMADPTYYSYSYYKYLDIRNFG